MVTLPKKQMGTVGILSTVFKCWLSTIIFLLPLSFLFELLKIAPALAIHFGWIEPYHKYTMLITLIVFTILSFIPLGATLARFNEALHGKKMPVVTALKIGASRLFTFTILGVIFYLALFLFGKFGALLAPHIGNWPAVSLVLLIIALMFPYFIPALPLLVVDKKWPFDAIASSVRLTKGHWFSSFVAMIACVVVIIALDLLYAFLLRIIGLSSEHLIYFGGIIVLFVLPLWTSLFVVVTENLKLPQ